MNCKELRNSMNHGSLNRQQNHPRLFEQSLEAEALDHLNACAECRLDVALENLTGALIKAHCDERRTEAHFTLNPFLMTRIRARIQELNGVGSWESAIVALRGWVIAFGVAAAVLLSISFQWNYSNSAANSDQEGEISTLSNLNEELITGNMVIPRKNFDRLAGEAVKHVNK